MNTLLNKITFRDFIQFVSVIVMVVGFYFGNTYRIQALEDSVKRLEHVIEKMNSTTEKIHSKVELDIQNLKNDVNATTMRLELLKQEVEYWKKR